jgi:hypothetical protein
MMRWLPALLWLVLIVWAIPGTAQTAIHRCIGANGNPLFTDQTCAALQATPIHPAPVPSGSNHPLTEPPPILCAANFKELRQSVVDAFANRNANRMAGLMLWSGYGSDAAVADIRSLNALMQQSLLDVGPPDDPATTGTDAPAPDAQPATPPAGDQLVLHTTGIDGDGNPHERRYDIVRRAGCLWLRNAG